MIVPHPVKVVLVLREALLQEHLQKMKVLLDVFVRSGLQLSDLQLSGLQLLGALHLVDELLFLVVNLLANLIWM